MSQMKKNLEYAGFIAIIALATAYVFWGGDLIPETIVSSGPGFIVGFADDAVVILGAIIAGTRWKNKMSGKKTPSGTKGGKGLIDKILLITTIGLILTYIFWVPDLLPDGTPVVGYLDDALAALSLAKLGRKVRDKIGK